MLLADLRKQSKGPLYLSFLDLRDDSQDSFPMLSGVYIRHGLASTEDLAQSSCPNRQKYIKASIKGHKMAVQAAKHFNSTDQAASHQMRITDTALVCGSPSEGHVKDLEGITSFDEVEFWFNESVSSQHLHFSGWSQPLHETNGNKGKLIYDCVSLQSGMCLFSMDMIHSSLDTDSRVDVSRIVYPTPTLYEAEYIARACPAIADMYATVLHTTMRTRRQSPSNIGDVTLQVGLDVPSFHYFHSVEAKIQDQACTFADALQWMHVVIQRHKQISEVYQSYLRHQLAQRDVDPRQMNIKVSRRGMLVAEYILKALERSKMPSFDEALRLLRENDDTWNDFWEILPLKERAVDFRSLSYLFYVYEVIRPCLERNMTAADSRLNSKANTGRLIIGIDDSAERPIYSRSQKLLKKIRNHALIEQSPFLMEIYMSRRVFINNNVAGSNLYLDDPSPQKPAVAPWRPLGAEPDQLKPFPSDLGPFDLIKKLYGEGASTLLQELFRNVGL